MYDPTETTTQTQSQTGGTGPTANWRDLRQAERQARREARWNRGGIPVGGIVLLVIGAALLFGHLGVQLAAHWWALLLLVPGAGMLVGAARTFRVDGTVTGRVIAAAVPGAVLLGLGLTLYLGIHWHGFWPLLLIAIGAVVVTRRGWARRQG